MSDRELGLIDEPDAHWPHDYGTDGRCRIAGCDVYDPAENDDDNAGSYWD